MTRGPKESDADWLARVERVQTYQHHGQRVPPTVANLYAQVDQYRKIIVDLIEQFEKSNLMILAEKVRAEFNDIEHVPPAPPTKKSRYEHRSKAIPRIDTIIVDALSTKLLVQLYDHCLTFKEAGDKADFQSINRFLVDHSAMIQEVKGSEKAKEYVLRQAYINAVNEYKRNQRKLKHAQSDHTDSGPGGGCGCSDEHPARDQAA